MTRRQRILKRSFDLCMATLGLLRIDTGSSGFFRQERIGRGGHPFCVIKLRTMRDLGGTCVTTVRDPRITRVGARLRRMKLDELPQLWNVLIGEMSFVGPRPDVPGFLDQLQGADRALLQLRPGITGPATLQFRQEEEMLAEVSDPEEYNRAVIWPEKVRLNRAYLADWSLARDLSYIARTLVG